MLYLCCTQEKNTGTTNFVKSAKNKMEKQGRGVLKQEKPSCETQLNLLIISTDGGNRTPTLLREPDFESGASTNSATSAFWY